MTEREIERLDFEEWLWRKTIAGELQQWADDCYPLAGSDTDLLLNAVLKRAANCVMEGWQ